MLWKDQVYVLSCKFGFCKNHFTFLFSQASISVVTLKGVLQSMESHIT